MYIILSTVVCHLDISLRTKVLISPKCWECWPLKASWIHQKLNVQGKVPTRGMVGAQRLVGVQVNAHHSLCATLLCVSHCWSRLSSLASRMEGPPQLESMQWITWGHCFNWSEFKSSCYPYSFTPSIGIDTKDKAQ